MRILVFGSTGMLGHTLIKYFQTHKSIDIEFTARNQTKKKFAKKYLVKKQSILSMPILTLH